MALSCSASFLAFGRGCISRAHYCSRGCRLISCVGRIYWSGRSLSTSRRWTGSALCAAPAPSGSVTTSRTSGQSRRSRYVETRFFLHYCVFVRQIQQAGTTPYASMRTPCKLKQCLHHFPTMLSVSHSKPCCMDPAVLLSSNQLQQIGCGMDVTPPFSKNFLQVGMYVCTYVCIYIYICYPPPHIPTLCA